MGQSVTESSTISKKTETKTSSEQRTGRSESKNVSSSLAPWRRRESSSPPTERIPDLDDVPWRNRSQSEDRKPIMIEPEWKKGVQRLRKPMAQQKTDKPLIPAWKSGVDMLRKASPVRKPSLVDTVPPLAEDVPWKSGPKMLKKTSRESSPLRKSSVAEVEEHQDVPWKAGTQMLKKSSRESSPARSQHSESNEPVPWKSVRLRKTSGPSSREPSPEKSEWKAGVQMLRKSSISSTEEVPVADTKKTVAKTFLTGKLAKVMTKEDSMNVDKVQIMPTTSNQEPIESVETAKPITKPTKPGERRPDRSPARPLESIPSQDDEDKSSLLQVTLKKKPESTTLFASKKEAKKADLEIKLKPSPNEQVKRDLPLSSDSTPSQKDEEKSSKPIVPSALKKVVDTKKVGLEVKLKSSPNETVKSDAEIVTAERTSVEIKPVLDTSTKRTVGGPQISSLQIPPEDEKVVDDKSEFTIKLSSKIPSKFEKPEEPTVSTSTKEIETKKVGLNVKLESKDEKSIQPSTAEILTDETVLQTSSKKTVQLKSSIRVSKEMKTTEPIEEKPAPQKVQTADISITSKTIPKELKTQVGLTAGEVETQSTQIDITQSESDVTVQSQTAKHEVEEKVIRLKPRKPESTLTDAEVNKKMKETLAATSFSLKPVSRHKEVEEEFPQPAVMLKPIPQKHKQKEPEMIDGSKLKKLQAGQSQPPLMKTSIDESSTTHADAVMETSTEVVEQRKLVEEEKMPWRKKKVLPVPSQPKTDTSSTIEIPDSQKPTENSQFKSTTNLQPIIPLPRNEEPISEHEVQPQLVDVEKPTSDIQVTLKENTTTANMKDQVTLKRVDRSKTFLQQKTEVTQPEVVLKRIPQKLKTQESEQVSLELTKIPSKSEQIQPEEGPQPQRAHISGSKPDNKEVDIQPEKLVDEISSITIMPQRKGDDKQPGSSPMKRDMVKKIMERDQIHLDESLPKDTQITVSEHQREIAEDVEEIKKTSKDFDAAQLETTLPAAFKTKIKITPKKEEESTSTVVLKRTPQKQRPMESEPEKIDLKKVQLKKGISEKPIEHQLIETADDLAKLPVVRAQSPDEGKTSNRKPIGKTIDESNVTLESVSIPAFSTEEEAIQCLEQDQTHKPSKPKKQIIPTAEEEKPPEVVLKRTQQKLKPFEPQPEKLDLKKVQLKKRTPEKSIERHLTETQEVQQSMVANITTSSEEMDTSEVSKISTKEEVDSIKTEPETNTYSWRKKRVPSKIPKDDVPVEDTILIQEFKSDQEPRTEKVLVPELVPKVTDAEKANEVQEIIEEPVSEPIQPQPPSKQKRRTIQAVEEEPKPEILLKRTPQKLKPLERRN